jgi:hypothetical protein
LLSSAAAGSGWPQARPQQPVEWESQQSELRDLVIFVAIDIADIRFS